ncbi:MAG: hypothetical protein LBT02_00790 [Rickettsiales bacterium]|jgi:hypothetical protein|nr:hypothetical protein [Rickettsiales bacterium]
MKKIFLFIVIVFVCNANASIVDNVVKDEQKFGEWTVSCEEDVMYSDIQCKVYTRFYKDEASIFIQPNNKNINQVVIMLPDAMENSVVMIKIDKNSIINSDPVDKKNRYGVIPFSPKKQKSMLLQMKEGDNMLVRFNVRDSKVPGGVREITAKISLAEFGKMLIFYDSKIDKR